MTWNILTLFLPLSTMSQSVSISRVLGMTIYILAEMNIFLFASFRTYQF
jgi:hypothetical protein